MLTFYICRHGQTYNNQIGYLSGWYDTPLTEEGRVNAQNAAVKLRGVGFDEIISSDLGRAVATAEIIAQQLGYTGEIVKTPDLREVNYGQLGNKPIEAFPKLTPLENANFIPPEGESLLQMQKRVLHFVAQLSHQRSEGAVLLVAHDGTINAIRADFEYENIGIVDAVSSNSHDFVAKFSFHNGKVRSFNQVF